MRKAQKSPVHSAGLSYRPPLTAWCQPNPPTDDQPLPAAAMLWHTDGLGNITAYYGSWERLEGAWYSNTYPRVLTDDRVHAYAWIADLTDAASLILDSK